MSDNLSKIESPARLALVITTAIHAMVAVAALTLPVMAPEVARTLGTSPAYIGLFVAILYVGAVFSSLGEGSAVARFGAIRTSQAGLLLCAAGLALRALPWLPATAAGALVLGLGYGPITPASSHLLARTTPAHRMSLVFSIKQTGVPLGGVLAGALVPAMLLGWGWQAALLCVAGANVLCAVCRAGAALARRTRCRPHGRRPAPVRAPGRAHAPGVVVSRAAPAGRLLLLSSRWRR